MNSSAPQRFACPCCGFRTRTGPPGTYDLCPVCWWEDDPIQFRDPEYAGGANRVSLREARENYRNLGASEAQFQAKVRPPRADERREGGA